MDRGNKKQEVLAAALELFSVQGYEATSVSQLADAVGIRKASLYSHFDKKQSILDELIRQVLEHYEKGSIFAGEDQADNADALPSTPDSAIRLILAQMQYILHDNIISSARKMLVIEQFRNPMLAELQTKQNYTDVMGYFTRLIGHLIRRGVLVEDDPEIMAAQLCLPISVWLNLCDREPHREPEVMALVEKHIRQFFRLYQRGE